MSRYRHALSLTALAVAMTLAAGQRAQAAFGDFELTTTITTPAGGTVTAPSGNSQLNFLGPVTTPATGNASGPGTSIIFGQVQEQDLGISTSYTDNYSVDYTFAVTVTDTTSGESAAFNINGTLAGFITATGVNFSSMFTNTYSEPLTQTVNIGGTDYTLDLTMAGLFTQPSPPNAAGGVSSTNGTFAVVITTGGPVVPEPGSMALLGIGGLMAVALSRRLRRVS
jgi:hypothetical protein